MSNVPHVGAGLTRSKKFVEALLKTVFVGHQLPVHSSFLHREHVYLKVADGFEKFFVLGFICCSR